MIDHRSKIAADTAALVAIMNLLVERRSLTEWPVTAQAILALSLDDTEGNRFEQAKAVRLRHHLFGDRPIPPLARAAVPGRRAERVRADLAGVVPIGTGLHLTSSLP